MAPDPGFNTFNPPFVAPNDNWLQELVRFVLLVSLLDSGNRVLGCFTLALDQTIDSDLDPFPPLITVHSIVSTDDGDEFSDLFLLDKVEKFLCIFGRGTGSSITAIAEEVDIDVRNLEFLCSLKEREEMRNMGMNTTIRNL